MAGSVAGEKNMDGVGNQPWWKRGLLVALIGAAIPVATLMQGWMQKNRELAIQRDEQLQELRLAYMGAMVEGGVDRVEMLADFIADTEPDAAISAWAVRQRSKSQATVKELKDRLAEEQKSAAVAAKEHERSEQRARKAEETARRLAAQASVAPAEKARAETAAVEANAAAAKTESEAVAQEAEVVRTREKLNGSFDPRTRLAVPLRQRLFQQRPVTTEVTSP
jgi:septal ring factor EnvC (AmiA/AmiB activator)